MGIELKSALYALIPREGNNNTVKIFTLVATGVWAIATLGVLFGYVPLESKQAIGAYATLTTFASYMFGRVHTEERKKLEDGD